MSAYNQVNGAYCSENEWLLETVLRNEWGFEGAVISDWGAVKDRVKGVVSGLDLEMPTSGTVNDKKLLAALSSGALDEAQLDKCVTRVVALVLAARQTRAHKVMASDGL
jgi:beta-glucosidase